MYFYSLNVGILRLVILKLRTLKVFLVLVQNVMQRRKEIVEASLCTIKSN